jgi:hypothetical protein
VTAPPPPTLWESVLPGALGTVLVAAALAGCRRLHRWLFTPRSFKLGGYRADRPTETLIPNRWQLFWGTHLARVRWGTRRRRP